MLYNGRVLTELSCGAEEIGIKLDHNQLDRFETYYRELITWNQKTNLTRITSSEDVQIKHFLDSLTVALALPRPITVGLSLLDVGSGAGFPGLPLKILFPEIHLVLLEATGKKAAFLEHIKSAFNLTETAVLALRAEEAAHLPPYRARFDAVVSRAVAELPTLLELTLPFCRLDGCVIAMKKGDIQAELKHSVRALELLGGKISEVKEVLLPGTADKRFLVVITKTAPTPAAYPRRPGMPAKRPLV